MTGRNINIYFQEETYNKLRQTIGARKISHFVNVTIEEKLQKIQRQAKETLKQKKIAGYQRAMKNKTLQKELEIYDEVVGDGLEQNE
ncbi:hypothetical protein [endosymbiont GvMRE of Glomus versiforme]|uniref:hypothetical protein n=1 Tax=endosymbiont GvMRE of Glomus versiforme TaxID=2039283 RepID=UPI000EC1EEA2|nr:hypothetical protein [endosymbiont GvMRE of Glomus versiforme]RHZ35739.1 hypothetical protein GvMRE_Ic6g29 [endosymbiont GvMRE of Glomus versiforme]